MRDLLLFFGAFVAALVVVGAADALLTQLLTTWKRERRPVKDRRPLNDEEPAHERDDHDAPFGDR